MVFTMLLVIGVCIYIIADGILFYKSRFYYKMMRIILTMFFITFMTVEIDSLKKDKHRYLAYEVDVPVPLNKSYNADWDDLDTRPLPKWYDIAKIGVFIHWGVYSVPSISTEWFWQKWLEGQLASIKHYMIKNYPPGFTYQEFAPMFTAELFDPEQWAALIAKSGAKYVVLTSKHHEGFTLFPSKRSFSWNSVDIGPKRDLVGDLARAVRNMGLKFGIYYSLYEWYNPMYGEDRIENFKTRIYPETKVWPELMQVVNDYEPSIIWSDGDWEAPQTYWNSTDFLAWLYNESPIKNEVVVNDRWGKRIMCHHGDFYTCSDRYNPGTLQKHKWENAFTLDKDSWGYRRNVDISRIMTFDELLYQVISTVSCGGNALINIGPTKDGIIIPIFQERLLSLGKWLDINGEAIYNTSPWYYQRDSLNTTKVWYTCQKVTYNAANPIAVPRTTDEIIALYAIFLEWPADTSNLLKVKDIASYLHTAMYHVEMLGNKGSISWKITNGIVHFYLPDRSAVKSTNAWTLKITLVT